MISDCPCGFSFYLPDHTPHLAVVIVELKTNPEQVIVVNLTSFQNGADYTVILKEGDHPFIKYKTIVEFGRARMFKKPDLINRINRELFNMGEPFSQELVSKMQRGIIDSEFTPNDIKELCEEALNNSK